MVKYKKDVQSLLGAYEEYKRLLEDESSLSTQLAKQKILGAVDPQLADCHKQVKQSLRELSDSMTFSNPFVWIMYKFEAYKNEAQPIRTMRDFRIHCSKEGYICTKRFTFLNEQLALKKKALLTDQERYKDDDSLDFLLEDSTIQELVDDPDVMTLWRSYEFNTLEGITAKWENY